MYLSDLKPTPKHMQIGRSAYEAPPIIGLMCLSKPTEEEKDVSNSNPSGFQM